MYGARQANIGGHLLKGFSLAVRDRMQINPLRSHFPPLATGRHNEDGRRAIGCCYSPDPKYRDGRSSKGTHVCSASNCSNGPGHFRCGAVGESQTLTTWRTFVSIVQALDAELHEFEQRSAAKLISKWRSLLKNWLIGPTLLEMSLKR
jgi:hypothetical protein